MEQNRGMKRVLFALTRFILDILPQNMIIKSICIRLTGLLIRVVMWYKSAPFLESPNVFKSLWNFPLNEFACGAEENCKYPTGPPMYRDWISFLCHKGHPFSTGLPIFRAEQKKKPFCWPVHFKLKHPPWLSMKKKGKNGTHFLVIPSPPNKNLHIWHEPDYAQKNQTLKWNLSRFRKTSPKVDDVFPLENVSGIFEYLVPPNPTEEYSAKRQVL